MTNTYIFIASMHYKVHLTVSHSMSFAPSRIHDLLVQQPQFERTNHLSKYWSHSLLNIYSSIQILCAPPTVLHHQRRSLAIIQYSSADSIGPDKRSSDRCVFSHRFFCGFSIKCAVQHIYTSSSVADTQRTFKTQQYFRCCRTTEARNSLFSIIILWD